MVDTTGFFCYNIITLPMGEGSGPEPYHEHTTPDYASGTSASVTIGNVFMIGRITEWRKL